MLANNFYYGYPFTGPMSFNYGDGSLSYQSRDQDYRPGIRLDGPYIKFLMYDPAGNIAHLNDANNTVLSYAYDATGRLVSAIDSASNGFGSLGYSYDRNGNRQTETRNAGTMSYVYSPPGSNWLYQRGSDTRIKSPNGNTAFGTPTGFLAYDGYNRLVTSATGVETTTYTYNALGERVRKINQNGLSTAFHYGPNGELLYEQDANGNTKAYVWLDGRPLARIDNNAQIYYYHVDHLGTPQAMSDAAGTTVWKAYYEPFGKATVSPASTVENNLRLPGQYYDRETGLHYNYFRDYDPTTGRYIEADPIGLAGGLNLYGYANQNPVLSTDPLGLCPRGWKQAEGQQEGICEPDDRVEPDKARIGEGACGLPPPPLPDPCNAQCGLGSPDWGERSIVSSVVSGAANMTGLPGKVAGLVFKFIDKRQCVQECKRRLGAH